jgi:hypothetical protein
MQLLPIREYLKKCNKHLKEEIISLTNFLDEAYERVTFQQRYYHVDNNDYKLKYCDYCKKVLCEFQRRTRSYPRFCSTKCSANCPKKIEQMKKNLLERYGVDNVSKIPSVKTKREETFLKKYGGHPMGSAAVVEKIRKTNLAKYGVEHPLQNKEILNKVKSTNLEKYGYECSLSHPEIRKVALSNMKKTNLDRYGVESTLRLNSVIEASKKTLIENYGVDNFSKRDGFKRDYIASYNDDIDSQRLDEYMCDEFIGEFITDKTVTEFCEYFQVCRATAYKRVKEIGGSFVINNSNTSVMEDELIEWLSEMSIKVVANDRSIISPFELDLYIPEHDLAIECNGSYWHSEIQGKDKNYHLNKTNLCKLKGIHLLHLWEHDWNYKKDAMKQNIKNLLGIDSVCINDEFSINIVTTDEMYQFMQEAFVSHAISADAVCIGGYSNGILVFGMCLLPIENGGWKISDIVDVSANRDVFKQAILYFFDRFRPTKVVYEHDKMIPTNTVLIDVGFSIEATIQPRCYYSKNYQKFYDISMINIKNFKENITEWENMQANGYDRIWDCGADILVWKKD